MDAGWNSSRHCPWRRHGETAFGHKQTSNFVANFAEKYPA
jgi:hypothetical protein